MASMMQCARSAGIRLIAGSNVLDEERIAHASCTSRHDGGTNLLINHLRLVRHWGIARFALAAPTLRFAAAAAAAAAGGGGGGTVVAVPPGALLAVGPTFAAPQQSSPLVLWSAVAEVED